MNLEKLNARRAALVTPNDSTDLPMAAFALYIGGAGNVKVTTTGGDTLLFSGLAAGSYLNVQVKRVWSTTTSATLIVALA